MKNLRTLLAGPIARGTVVSLVIRLAGIGLGALQAILTARLLGPDGYGVIAFVLSLSMVAATVALAGTETLAVREVAKYAGQRDLAGLRGFLRTIRLLLAGTVIAGIAILAAVLANASIADEFRSVLFYVAVIFPTFAFVLQTQGVLRGLGQTALSQIPFLLVRPLIMVSVLSVCLVAGLAIGPVGYLNTVVAGAGVSLVLAAGAAVLLTPRSDAPSRDLGVVGVASRSGSFLAISVLGLLLAEINTLMLAWWTTPEETGLFQPIARIAPLVVLGTQAASMRYAPRVSELWAQGETERIASITRLFTLTTTGFALALALCVVLFDEEILGLFGEEFTASTTALWWVAGAQVFNAACGPVGMLLTMTDRANLAVWPQAGALTIAIVLGYALIPTFGVLGAAVAMSASTLAWNIAMLAIVVRKMNIDPSILGVLKGPRGTSP